MVFSGGEAGLGWIHPQKATSSRFWPTAKMMRSIGFSKGDRVCKRQFISSIGGQGLLTNLHP